jgi:hypothetical protein
MTKPVQKAEPFFSQPVRQILTMVIVTVLVVVGAYLAFANIFPIFLSNVWLNGAILAVFSLGVLTCFWQVIQLVGSVSWIEGFAADRPGHEVTKPPQLLVPLAALLRSRGARSQISNSSARSILESVASRVDEAQDITRYLSNLLIFLGLLGTFFGLATTVPGVVDTIRALAPKEGESSAQVFEQLMGGLGTQLSGMGTAFSSSLLGLAGSLVVGLLELFAGHGQSRFYRELEEWLSSFTRLSFAGSDADGSVDQTAIATVLDQMSEQMEALQTIFSQSDVSRQQVDERLLHLVGAVERLADTIEGERGGSAALDRIADGQARMIGLMEAKAAAPDGSGGAAGDAESRMRLRSIDVQLLKLLEEVAAGRQESMADLRSDLAQLTRAVRALARTADAAPAPARRG